MAGKNEVGFKNTNISDKALANNEEKAMNDKAAVSPTHEGPNMEAVKGIKMDSVVKGQDVGKRK